MMALRRIVGTGKPLWWKAERTMSTSWGSFMHSLNPFADNSITGNKFSNLEEKYEVLHELGTGRYGVVRLVRNKESNEEFACKSMAKDDVNDTFELRNEIKMLEKLDHPHLLGIIEAIEDRENVHLVSKLCTGGELFDRIIQEGCFSEKDAAVITRQILLGLEYLHTKLHIVHRDVKPENVLFLTNEPKSPLTMIDFGMAREISDTEFLHSSCGSPSYVAPEVLDENYTEKCDIWSVGVILYILLCGKVPFGGATDEDILRSVARAKYDFKDPAWQEVSESAISLIRGLMHINPLQRMSATEALSHPWIQQLGEGRSRPLQVAFKNMQSFRSYERLKKTSIQVIAKHLAASSQANEKDKYLIRLRQLFQSLDQDKTGLVSAELLATAILAESKKTNSFNVMASQEELAQLLQKESTNGEGQIDLGEFIGAAVTESIYLENSNLKFAFDFFDKDQSGSISLDELRDAYGSNAPDNLEEDFERLDLNKDGSISYDEFCEMMRDGRADSRVPLKSLKPFRPPSSSS